MNLKDDILPYLLIIAVVLAVGLLALGFASQSENNFNKTLDAVKSNTDLIFSKTNMTGSEKTNYIVSECQIVFGNGQYRPNDVELCKTNMGLK